MIGRLVALAVLLMVAACSDLSDPGNTPQHGELRIKAIVLKLDSTIAAAISNNNEAWPSQYGVDVLAEYSSGKAQTLDCTVTFGFSGMGRYGLPEHMLMEVADFDRATEAVTPRDSVHIAKVPLAPLQPMGSDPSAEATVSFWYDDLSVRTRNGVVIVSMHGRRFAKADNPRISARIRGVSLIGAVGEFGELLSLPGNAKEGRENAIDHAIRTGEEHLFILIVPQGTRCE